MAQGIVDRKSAHSVEDTVDRLKGILQSRGLTLFGVVDHSGEAEKVGISMPPTRLLIFGSAKAGTHLMLAAPSVAIDLPLKVLVRQDGDGQDLGLLQQPRIPAPEARFSCRAGA